MAMVITAVASLSAFVPSACAGTYWDGKITRISVDSDGNQANEDSSRYTHPTVSGDGRYTAFESKASNLVPGDTNEVSDIFVYDRDTGETERISVASDGTQADDHSFGQAISADGRFVAFSSHANNLVPNDTNSTVDVFVHDRDTKKTTRVSVASDGTQGFMSSGNGGNPSISADGRYIAFHAKANNLVPGDDENGFNDIFVHDRETGKTERVSETSDGEQIHGMCGQPSISADGRYVAFKSISKFSDDDTNEDDDIFVHDRETGKTELVSFNTDGSQVDYRSQDPQISGNGRYIVYYRGGDIFVYDRETRQTEKINVTSGGADELGWGASPTISADGRYVAYYSTADDLVGGADIYISILLHDRQTRKTYWVSSGVDRSKPSDASRHPTLSADGKYVAFMSSADNLISEDTNESTDVFLSSVDFRTCNIMELIPFLYSSGNKKIAPEPVE